MNDRYWSDRLAARIEPTNISGNMTLRADIWRALIDWSWGIFLETPYRRRLLWVYRRLRPFNRLDSRHGSR